MDETTARPLAGKRVVITRAAEQSKELGRALERAGAIPIVFPVVRVAPPEKFGALDTALRSWAEFDWVFFTSQNAVRAVRDRADEAQIALRVSSDRPRIAAVGRATGEEARLAGFSGAHVASRPQGLALVEDLQGELRNRRVLLPRSDRADPELVRELESCGAQVTDVIAYRTITGETTSKAAQAEIARADAVLLFSPSAVAGLREILGLQALSELSKQAVVAAIGPVTNAALKKTGIEDAIVAEEASVAGIVEALANFFAHREHTLSTGAKPR